jgi:hypothetical protein
LSEWRQVGQPNFNFAPIGFLPVEGFEPERRIKMKFLKYASMAMVLMSALAITSTVARAEAAEECAEPEASVSALPLAAAAFFGIPSAFVLARRRRKTNR